MRDPVVERRPPDSILRVVNPVLRRAVGSPLGRALPGLAVLEFSGSRTGRRYRVVTGWYRLDGQEFAVTPARWRVNFAAGAPLVVTNCGQARSGAGLLVTDPDVVTVTVQRLLDVGTSPTALGLAVARGHRLTSADTERTGKALVQFTPNSG